MIDDKQIEAKVKKEIDYLVEDKIASWFLIRYLKKCARKFREEIIGYIIFRILGAAFSSAIITIIFKKEIAELISDAENITKESLIKFVELVSRFKKKKSK